MIMMTLNIVLLISALASFGSAVPQWTPVCQSPSQESNIGLFIKGAKIVDKYNLKSGLTVIVENTKDVENVTVKCTNPGGDEEIYDVKNRPRGNEKILWLKNKISFWRTKYPFGEENIN